MNFAKLDLDERHNNDGTAAADAGHHRHEHHSSNNSSCSSSDSIQGDSTPSPVRKPSLATQSSSIGFGVVHLPFTSSVTDAQTKQSVSASNATAAAVRAVCDAMERKEAANWAYCKTSLYVHLKIGVPPKKENGTEPMVVDQATVHSTLTRVHSNWHVLAIDIVVGGLLTNDGKTCTAVACLSLGQNFQEGNKNNGANNTTNSRSEWNQQVVPGQPHTTHTKRMAPTKSTSMESIASISAVATHKQQQPHEQLQATFQAPEQQRALQSRRTPKTKHNPHDYNDFSNELPCSPDYQHLATNLRNSQTPFPLKLHEMLHRIHLDGLDHIVGWLPHGRAFRIHDQDEFATRILPHYWSPLHPKKTSFLRQLNLYGFRRISKGGPDQGSYFHECFLLGMKFLTRRIHRNRVNGNGRSVNNPEHEPNFANFPQCPTPYLTTVWKEMEQVPSATDAANKMD
jgi:hypothetical protein